jgi:hypothetical protein
MISFVDYLKNNQARMPNSDRLKSITPALSNGVNYTDNSQAIGDVSGGGTIGGAEDEESMLANLLKHTQAEEEEGQLELVDDNESDNDTEQPDEQDQTELPTEDEPNQDEDPDKQGLIRTIPKAHLVYKREGEDGAYEELWMYEIKKGMRDEYDIRNDILAGTDIPPKQTKSEDESQSYTMWTAGDMQLLKIVGLPN